MLPATISVAPNSPSARAEPRMSPATTPRRASGSVTRHRISHSDEPRVRAAFSRTGSTPATAAREALQAAGVWETVAQKLVYGENVSQTLQYAESGNVDAAVVALSLSTQSKGRWVLIPAEMHKPLNQALAVIKDSRHHDAAQTFAAYVLSPEGQALLERYGYKRSDK